MYYSTNLLTYHIAYNETKVISNLREIRSPLFLWSSSSKPGKCWIKQTIQL